MKNKIVSDGYRTYKRLSKRSAEKAFMGGKTLYVMSIDRNPINSLTSAYMYYIGCKPLYLMYDGIWEINTFEDLLEDFSGWLETDGYGHMPQRYDAKNYRFSYWEKIV